MKSPVYRPRMHNAEADRIRRVHGACVGISAGANMTAARRLHEGGATVATIWPDCSDRYLSVGLKPPATEDVSCPLKEECTARSQAMLGELPSG